MRLHRAHTSGRRASALVLFMSLVTFGVAVAWAPAPADASDPAPAPLVIDPARTLNAQFGYAPPFTRVVPTFDEYNRPYLRSRSSDPDATAFVHTLRDGAWTRLDLLRPLRAAYPTFKRTVGAAGVQGNRVVWDERRRAYTWLTIQLTDGSYRNLLLSSLDHGATWHVTELPPGDVWCETPTVHAHMQGPPFVMVSKVSDLVDPASGRRRRLLYVTQPRWQDASIVVPSPRLLSTHALGTNGGGDSPLAVSDGRFTYVVFMETTATPRLGSPTIVTAYDHATDTIGPPVTVAASLPGNDGHNRPGICLDSSGVLHVVAGSHGRPFVYTHAMLPGTAYGGWTPPVDVLATGWKRTEPQGAQRGRQTYLTLACDQQDWLHIAFRQWRRGVDPYFKGDWYGALSYQRKPPDGPWEDARLMIVPAYPHYGLFYHQLSVDRTGRLFLSACSISGPEVQARRAALASWKWSGRQGTAPPQYLRRVILMSVDQGASWRLATSDDFVAGVAP